MATEEQKRKARARARALFAMRYVAYLKAVGAQPEFQEPSEPPDEEEEPTFRLLTEGGDVITTEAGDPIKTEE